MDIEDVTQVYQEINNIDHVYHCAAIVSFQKRTKN